MLCAGLSNRRAPAAWISAIRHPVSTEHAPQRHVTPREREADGYTAVVLAEHLARLDAREAEAGRGGALYTPTSSQATTSASSSTETIGDDEVPADGALVELPAPAIQISDGYDHACALLNTGKVRCWGSNTYGALGTGHPEAIGDDESVLAGTDVALDEGQEEREHGSRDVGEFP